MLMPKRMKYRKQFRGRMTGRAYRGEQHARLNLPDARSSEQ